MSLIALALAFPTPVQAATVEEPVVVFDSGGACRILSDGDDIFFRGCNVFVQNETGATDQADGLGNLVVGWSEADGTEQRTGSHNLVVGPYNDWRGTSSLIAGQYHRSHASYNAVVGGRNNLASRDHASVVGGRSHKAQGRFATILGGVDTSTAEVNGTLLAGLSAADIGAMRKDIAEVATITAEIDAEVATLGSKFTGLSGIVGDLGADYDVIRAAVVDHGARLGLAEAFIAEMPSTLTALYEGIQGNTLQIDSLSAGLQALSGTTHARLTSLEESDREHGETLYAHQKALESTTSDIGTLQADVADLAWTLDGFATALPDLQAAIADWAGVSQYLFVEAGDLVVQGANLRIRSGMGATNATVNGKGNLIVGYDEGYAPFKAGSHNVIVGEGHAWGSHSGIVAGYGNVSTAPGTVLFGVSNIVSGAWSTVTGGVENVVTGTRATIAGGRGNDATGEASSVTGGLGNTASGDFASVTGGSANEAVGDYGSVTGGSGNTAGTLASVSGGVENSADGFASSISGGTLNVSDGARSWIGGGEGNLTDALTSAVAGGHYNRATGVGSTVTGGHANEASGLQSSVSGGSENDATGERASVSGGLLNEASGTLASVSGGWDNTASGLYTNALGGQGNLVSGNSSVAAGGFNTVTGRRSVAFGAYNLASGEESSVLGGFQSEAQAEGSVVVGGFFGLNQNRYGVLGGGRSGWISGETWGAVETGTESYPCFEGCF